MKDISLSYDLKSYKTEAGDGYKDTINRSEGMRAARSHATLF